MNYLPKFIVQKIKSRPWLSAGIAGALLILLVLAFVLPEKAAETEENQEGQREVELLNVSEYQRGAIGLTAPTASGDSFVIRSEGSGKLVSVARPGKVNQGAVIASFNNASERAALVQAEGVLDAAKAAGAQGDIGAEDAGEVLEAAKQSAVNSYRSALNSWHSALYNTVDQVFASPRIGTPGILLSAAYQEGYLNDARTSMRDDLTTWQNRVETLNSNDSSSSIQSSLDTAVQDVDALRELIRVIFEALSRQDADQRFTEADIARLQTEFAAAETAMNNTRSELQAANSALARAEEGTRSASIGSTGSVVSSANAQIKQAQGAYMAALANYNKTIVRAPFAGVVTNVNVKVGEILSYGADVAIIQPNDGVETESSFILPLSAVKYTPDGALVFTVNSDNKLESKPVETGLVTADSITITGLNGDERIVSDVRGLKAGEAVAVK